MLKHRLNIVQSGRLTRHPFFTDTPTGELPYLEVGEKQLTQSLTIARYLAREFGESSKSRHVKTPESRLRVVAYKSESPVGHDILFISSNVHLLFKNPPNYVHISSHYLVVTHSDVCYRLYTNRLLHVMQFKALVCSNK